MVKELKPAVFLDRDGVINIPHFRDGRSYAPTRFEEFELYPDAVDAVSKLKAAGFYIVLVTNQPDVGKGLVEQTVVEQMHEFLGSKIPMDDIQVCYDTREAENNRLKPSPAMILDAAENLNVDLSQSYMIGDRSGDIQAGVAAGCGACVFIDRGYSAENPPIEQSVSVAGLGEAADWVLSQVSSSN